MERFICPDCGKVSYSADRSNMECPYCTERIVIINNRCIDFLRSISNVRLVFDRRQGERRNQEISVSDDRRVADRRKNEGIVIGWVTTKKRDSLSESLA